MLSPQEDVERLSWLGRDHIKIHGHYPFVPVDVVHQFGCLPLREWEEGNVAF